MKVLAILPQIPYPAIDGGKQGLFYRINALSKHMDLTVVMIDIEKKGISADSLTKHFPFAKNIIVISRKSRSIEKSNIFFKTVEIIKWLISGKPREAQTYMCYNNELTDYILNEKFDVVDLEFTFMSELINIELLQKHNVKIVCTIHNIEHKFVYDVYKKRGIPKFICSYEADRLKKYEVNIMKIIDKIASISSYDTEYYNQLIGEDKVKYLPSILTMRDYAWTGEGDYIIFPGSLNFEPNLEAMRWFCFKILPKVVKKHPSLRLRITGKIPSQEIYKEFQGNSFIEFTGFLDENELINQYKKSLFAVIPILSGAGIKMKILDCMSMGVPVLCTEFAALGITNDSNVLCMSSNVDDFAKNMNIYIENEHIRTKLSRKSYDFFLMNYVSEKNVNKWIDFLKDDKLA